MSLLETLCTRGWLRQTGLGQLVSAEWEHCHAEDRFAVGVLRHEGAAANVKSMPAYFLIAPSRGAKTALINLNDHMRELINFLITPND